MRSVSGRTLPLWAGRQTDMHPVEVIRGSSMIGTQKFNRHARCQYKSARQRQITMSRERMVGNYLMNPKAFYGDFSITFLLRQKLIIGTLAYSKEIALIYRNVAFHHLRAIKIHIKSLRSFESRLFGVIQSAIAVNFIHEITING